MIELEQDEIEQVSGGLEMCRPGDGTVDGPSPALWPFFCFAC